MAHSLSSRDLLQFELPESSSHFAFVFPNCAFHREFVAVVDEYMDVFDIVALNEVVKESGEVVVFAILLMESELMRLTAFDVVAEKLW